MTARDLTAGMLTAIQAGHVLPALLFEGEFVDPDDESTEYLRLWTGIGALSWDSKTWAGGGHLLDISVLEESSEVKAVGFEVKVSGLPSARIAQALLGARRNRPGRLWLALFNSSGAIIADPYLLKRGKFSMIPIDMSGETATITIKYEDRLINLSKSKERRYTHESQQLRSPGDMGFSGVEALQDATFDLA